jgi:hypothetical protein
LLWVSKLTLLYRVTIWLLWISINIAFYRSPQMVAVGQ